MSKLRITPELSLPLDVITMRIALYGTSGSGKTTFARLIAEKVHEANHRFCAIDLKNDWWGLKATADGSAKGIPVVVFGGPRRDLQLFEDAAPVVADTIAAIDQSVVVDLDALSKGKQLRFLAAFLDRLYDVNRSPLLVIADEADRYAAQKPMSPEALNSLGAAEDICRRGRKRGIGSMWLTQRTAVLNKNVSDICDLTVVFRTPGARDLKELEDRVGRIASKEQTAVVMRLAPGLEDGQAIFLSSHPKLRTHLPDPVRPIQLPLPWTFDSSATPALGQRRREPKVLAQADLSAIETKMASQVERAKAEDPKELKREIAGLKRELAGQKRESHPVPREPKPKPVPVIKDSQITRLEKLADRFDKQRAALDETAAVTVEIVRSIRASMSQATQVHRPAHATTMGSVPTAQPLNRVPPPHIPTPTRRPVPVYALTSPTNGEHGPNKSLSDGYIESLVNVLVNRHPVPTPRAQLAGLAGKSTKSSAFGPNLREMIRRGLAEETRQGFVATEAAVSQYGDSRSAPVSGQAALQHWLSKLPAYESRLLREIVNFYPRSAAREDIAHAAGYSLASSAFGPALRNLIELQFVVQDADVYRAADLFFS